MSRLTPAEYAAREAARHEKHRIYNRGYYWTVRGLPIPDDFDSRGRKRHGWTPPRRVRQQVDQVRDGLGIGSACYDYMGLAHGVIADRQPLDRSKSPEQRAAERAELWARLCSRGLR